MKMTLPTLFMTMNFVFPLLAANKPIPVILDTDMGTDVDDAYALVLAARSPQLDLRAVTTVYGNVALRSAIARKLLLLMGKEQVVVASGQEKPFDGHEVKMGGWEGRGILTHGDSAKGVSQTPASDLIIQILSESPEKIVIASVGGLTNVAIVMQKQPSLLSKIQRFVIMGGCVRPFVLQGKKIPEHLETNLHHDVDAGAMVLRSGIPITLVPAEVTFKTKLFLRDFERIQKSSSPLARAMTYMTEDFGARLKTFMKSFGVDTYYEDMATLLHDPLAVHTLVDPSIVKVQKVKIRVENGNGKIRTVEDPKGAITIDLVTAVDAPRFSSVLTDRILEK
jgi:purine nucleosidase